MLMKKVIFLVLFYLMPAMSLASPTEPLKYLPVQDAGRVKPYDTFAREMLQMIYGRQTYEKRPAFEIVFTWLLQPTAWQDKKIIEIRYNDLKKALKFDLGEKHFSLEQILNNERLPMVMQELQAKRETKEKLNPYFQAVQRLENQIFLMREIASGHLLKVWPPQEGDAWVSVADLKAEQQETFLDLTKSFISSLALYNEPDASKEQLLGQEKELKQTLESFTTAAREFNPKLYPTDQAMFVEVHFNSLHPFQKAWILYLSSAILILLGWVYARNYFFKAAWGLSLLGFGFHIYGFAIRCFLMGRPPVSNMYESVVWVAFGVMLFAMIIELSYKFRYVLLAGNLVGALCLIIADSASAVLDSSLQPLEPVLRSNFWLLIHVLTITISYSAFFLAFGLGDMGLFYYLRGENKNKDKIKAIAAGIYRCIQIGVVFLAAGTILGGIWADYSWGRFWGWDPKETWALIALLGYLAVLHGRLGGWLKQFGLIAASIVAFSLVIMAWYGVNFVLGAGLHSYGFGAGGVEYVAAFVGIHLLYVVFAMTVYRGRKT